MAVILPHVLRRFGFSVDKKLSELTRICGITAGKDERPSEAFIRWIEEEKERMNISSHLDMIEDKDIPQIIEWALKEANPIYPVPKIWGEKEFKAVLKDIKGA